jgi:hypothetical protein
MTLWLVQIKFDIHFIILPYDKLRQRHVVAIGVKTRKKIQFHTIDKLN